MGTSLGVSFLFILLAYSKELLHSCLVYFQKCFNEIQACRSVWSTAFYCAEMEAFGDHVANFASSLGNGQAGNLAARSERGYLIYGQGYGECMITSNKYILHIHSDSSYVI